MSEPKKEHLRYDVSEERAKDLTAKIDAAVAYFQRAFKGEPKLTPKDVFGFLKRSVDKDRDRLFLSKLGSLSMADILWYAQQNGLDLAEPVNVEIGDVEKEEPAKSAASGKGAKLGKGASAKGVNGQAAEASADIFS